MKGAKTFLSWLCAAFVAAATLSPALRAAGSSAAQSPALAYGPPLRITSGGTYSGNWESQDPTVPAVLVLTADPVVIKDCNIRSKSDLINAQYVANAHVTVSNCHGYGLDPGVAGQQRGRFLFGFHIGSLTVEHNYIEATAYGVVLISTAGWSLDGPLSVRYNQFKNLDWAASDGNGGRIVTNRPDPFNSAVTFADYQGMQKAEIAWNEIENDPGVSWVGDTIDMYSSSGTASTPIEVHDNYIHGGYPGIPTSTLYYSGAITMDGNADDTAATATAFVKIHDNQIVAHANFGIGLAAGHDNEAYDNRVVSTGQYANGSWYEGYAGIYVIDCACYQQPPSVYFNNFAHDNVVGFRFEWAYPSNPNVFSPPPVRQDYLLPDCAGGASGPTSKCTNNVSLPDPITSATETSEYLIWQQKLSDNKAIIGPLTDAGTNYQGLWWAAPGGLESGWGINFAHQGDIVFASWFTYDQTGNGWWLVMTAGKTAANTYSGTLYQGTGPAFDAVPFLPLGAPGGAKPAAVGTGALTFADANNATFTYMVNGITQTKAITRELVGAQPVCTFGAQANLALATNYTDLWWAAPAGLEAGWGINLTHQGDIIFATWFTFAQDHTPMWLVVQATKTAPGTYAGTQVYRLTGPAFSAVPFPPIGAPGGPTGVVVGTATFTFSDGNNATFAYTVDGVSQTKAITREVFVAPGTVCQ